MKRRSRNILAVAVAASGLSMGSSSVRGGGSSATMNIKRNTSAKRIKSDKNNHRRPPIQDAHQNEKIKGWHVRQLIELCGEGGCHHQQHQQQLDHQQHQYQQPLSQPSSEQQQLPNQHFNDDEQQHRELYGGHHHKKKSYTYGADLHVKKSDADAVPARYQQHGPVPAPQPSNTNNNNGMVQNSSASNNTPPPPGGNYYYPLYTSTKTIGTCSNNGAEPTQYHLPTRSSNFLYTTLNECCNEWYIDVMGCINGFAYQDEDSGELLKRNWVTGELFPPLPSSSSSGGSGLSNSIAAGFADYSNTEPVPNNNNKYYPSFNMRLYPDGACLNDGNEPNGYVEDATNYLFDKARECCKQWFLSTKKCVDASIAAESTTTPSPTPGESSWPTWFEDNEDDDEATPWPTWADADFVQQDGDNNVNIAQQAKPAEEAPDIPRPHLGAQYLFYESFENGDFNSYDWSLPTYQPQGAYNAADTWEADRTSVAYDGKYAARPGILSTPNSQSNLTISLEGLEVSHGGLLTFAIHASVEMPVDVIYFTINHEVIRTFDKILWNDAGDWAEVSVVLLPGEHTLTWSYQYYGLPNNLEDGEEEYEMDVRRMGNSWVDAIALQAFTGDVAFSDGDDDAFALLEGSYNSGGSGSGGVWNLVSDGNAFWGSHSYIAYTQDISTNQGYIEMSWTIIAGPEGGILSFATYVSTYAPHDVLELVVNGVPEIAITTPSSNWEQKYIEIDPGRHTVKWRLVKNPPGLSQDVLDGVAVPSDYQGYAKVDGIRYMDNQVHYSAPTTTTTTTTSTTTTSTTTTTTTEEPTTTTTTEEPETTTTTTTTEETTTTTTTSTTTTEEPTTTTTTSTTTTEEPQPQAQPIVYDDCPEGTFAVDGLPNCCLEEPNYLGDGACDPWGPYNTEECAYDLGDCCSETCNHDSPYGCDTVEGEADYGPFGFFCIDPRYSIIDESKCEVENREWIGDGGCDAEGGYNTEECGWDMGDCCQETCNEEYSFYPCGQNQDYDCQDPNAGQTLSNPTGSGIHEEEDSPFYFHDGFESNTFNPSHWKYRDGNTGIWEIEHEDNTNPANEGVYYAEARTEDIIDNLGTAILELKVQGSGTLSYQVQALIQAPFEDVLITVDGVVKDIIMDVVPDWEVRTIEIDEEGQHRVQWIVRKNPTDASVDELAESTPNLGITRIDDVTFSPH